MAGAGVPACLLAMLEGDELSEEQKAKVRERVAALQAQFAAAEERAHASKVRDVLEACPPALGATDTDAAYALKVCNGNELEVQERLQDPDEGPQFLQQCRDMLAEEERLAQQHAAAKDAGLKELRKKQKRLRKRQQEGEEDDEDGEDDDEEGEEEQAVGRVEESYGVRFVRHSKKHVVCGRLKLDDALAKLEAATAAAQARAAEGGEGSGSGSGAGATPAKAPKEEELMADELMKDWSEARKKAWLNREKNENAYYYRFNAPGEAQAEGKWTKEMHNKFLARVEEVKAENGGVMSYQWGTFSKAIPGRVGYQCSNYYRTLVQKGDLIDDNYMLDDKGKLRFNFKNKGFDRGEDGRHCKEYTQGAPSTSAAPKQKGKRKGREDDDDDEFRCSYKAGPARTSGRNAGKRKVYTDGDEEEADETPVLPGFVDPITRMEVEEPCLSPFGHVMGYETWCRILRTEGMKDTCPFTKQPLKRRQLIKLTHDNIAEHRSKIVDAQSVEISLPVGGDGDAMED